MAIGDLGEDEMRRLRADFMLGNLTEDEYLEEARRMVRARLDDLKQLLTREEYAALEGDPDRDPFERDADGRALSFADTQNDGGQEDGGGDEAATP